MAKRIHRKTDRTPADKAQIGAIREEFQAKRPSLDELVASGEYGEPTTQQAYLEAKAIAHMLKRAREAAKMSLTDVANSTGMDTGMISRLENGVYPNTTINTLNRLALAYGKRIVFYFEDDSALAARSAQ